MGAVSIDLASKRKRTDDLYPYEPEGIAALLSDVYRAEARAFDRADLDSFTVITDLKLALDTDCLTPRQRQVVALYYFCELTLKQIGEILGVGARRVKKYLDASYERIAREMKDGGASRKGRQIKPVDACRPLYRWVNDVADGAPVYSLPDDVELDLLRWLSERGDDCAWETLRQRREGAPTIEYSCDYKCMYADQIRKKDRRMSFKEYVFPPGDVVGYRFVKPSDFKDEVATDEGYAEAPTRKKVFKHFYHS
jgi:hypothetical protein